MIWLNDKLEFPAYETASDSGLIALGGDLSSERLTLAYKLGIFPWYSEGEPIVWYCPPTRMVLFPSDLKVSKSMKQVLRKNEFIITENKAFEEVIYNCKNINRKDEFGTWITDEMEQAYINLHKLGVAKSIEVWLLDTERSRSEKEATYKLVGGLYGIDLGNGVFCGESMFTKVSNASKVAFIHLAKPFDCAQGDKKKYKLIDCQMHNEHLASLGAKEISREVFLEYLKSLDAN